MTQPSTVRSSRDVVQLHPPRVPLAEVQGTLALDLQPRQDLPDMPTAPVVPLESARRGDITGWAGRFAQAAVEIVGGDRPASQLLRWASEEVHADLARRAQLVARAGQHRPGIAPVQPVRPKVVGIHTFVIDPGVVEAALRVRYGPRSRALAARFEWRDERWICTALEWA